MGANCLSGPSEENCLEAMGAERPSELTEPLLLAGA